MPVQNTKPSDAPQAVRQQIALLAQNIVIARKRRKETQAQWAQRLGVSQPTMARIERGDPSVAMVSYVMCMWLINPALGLADLIAPQNDMASLEHEVARARSRSKARPAVQEDRSAKAEQGNARPSDSPRAPTATAPVKAAVSHVAREVANVPWDVQRSADAEAAAQRAAGLGISERVSNGTAAGLAALIAGHKKARP